MVSNNMPPIISGIVVTAVGSSTPITGVVYAGRQVQVTADVFDPASPIYHGQWRSLPTRANRQPAAAHYVRRPGDDRFRAQVLDVLRVEGGQIAEIIAFVPELFPAFGLPPLL